MGVLRLGRFGDIAAGRRIGGNQLAFSPVPFCENRCRGRAAHDARVDEAREAYVRDVSGRAEDALKVPYGLGPSEALMAVMTATTAWNGDIRFRIQFIQESTPILPVKDAGKPPGLVLERLNILNLYNEHISRLGGLDLKRPRKVMDLGEVDVLDVVCGIVVLDLTTGPVETFDLDDFVVCDLAAGRD